MIPALKLEFSASERLAVASRVIKALASGQVAQGKNVEEVEKRLVEFLKVKCAVAVSSGSDGLQMVFQELKDRHPEKTNANVIMPTNTFVATPLAAMRAGLEVKLCDMEENYFGLDLDKAKSMITDDTVAVVAVNIGGVVNPRLAVFAQELELDRDIVLVEDAAHSIGSIPTMSGHVAVGSFFATKVFTGGEGGAIWTNDQALSQHYRTVRNFGKSRAWESYHEVVGFNYRMSELAACLIAEELKRAKEVVEERNRIAYSYGMRLGLNRIVGMDRLGCCNFYKVIYRGQKPASTARVILNENDVQAQGGVYDIPVHRQPIFKDMNWGEFPVADRVLANHLCLPIWRGMRAKDIDRVVKVIKENDL